MTKIQKMTGLFLFCSALGIQGKAAGTPDSPDQAAQNKSTKKITQTTVGTSSAKTATPQNVELKPPSSTIRVVYPNGGEEIVAGNDLKIQWTSEKKGGTVRIVLDVENSLLNSATAAVSAAAMGLDTPTNANKAKIPIVIAANAPDTGTFTYRVPLSFNSRFGYKYKVVIQKGDATDESDQVFAVYPTIDLAPIQIKIRNKSSNPWGLRTLTSILTGGAAQLPGVAEAILLKEAVNYEKQDQKSISQKKDIIIEFDVVNRGIDIVEGSLMSKVAIRLHPGGAELNSAGFFHAKLIPGRNYHYKATINPKKWEIAPGSYRLEISVDPQNNAREPEPLRNNNTKTIQFQVK